ncbi:ABC transporter substrate-binding protein [Actinomyces viscosus]|uniref:Glutathione-binding protein gsiB n=1 Tax=Actinomyces viscosus TaxID=1656 RepID=A0A3S4VLU4_ACTVI|nr:ABC transporter substrate-binding protein [Actinomyces viscosus]TFH52784.1 ABC transporter substrate-binding protein [Actinomyces viscosus]VEI18369.1 Glutathione-binding protein gsiB precursor [Actinomyces viscosus]
MSSRLSPNRRQVLAALGIGAGATAVGACSFGAKGTKAGGRIRLVMFSEPKAALSPLSDDAFTLTRCSCAETLTMLDEEGNAKGLLASAWTRVDNTTWRFTIRDGVTFHDGTVLSAENVASSLTFTASAPKQPRVLNGVTLTATAEGKDVVIKTETADPLMPMRLSGPSLVILSPAAYPDAAGGSVDPVGHGTGAFKLTKITGKASATFDRYNKYWGDKAKAEGLDVTFVPEGSTRASSLISGNADLVEAIPIAQLSSVEQSAAVDEIAISRACTLYLNTSKVFSDPGLRAAVCAAINAQDIVDKVYEGHADASAGLLGSMVSWAADLRAWGRDVYSGASGAAAAGKVPGFPAATAVPAGTSITLGSYSDRPELPEAVVLLAQQLEQIGFTVTQDVRDYSQIETDALAGRFDAFLMSRNTVLDTGDSVAYMASDYSSTGTNALTFLKDGTVDAAISNAAVTEPGQERQKATMEAEHAILATGAVVPILHERIRVGHAKELTGVALDPRERALVTTSTTLGK